MPLNLTEAVIEKLLRRPTSFFQKSSS